MKKRLITAFLICGMLAAAIPVSAQTTDEGFETLEMEEESVDADESILQTEEETIPDENEDGIAELEESDETEEELTGAAEQNMYRMYNPNSGEHFYTAKTAERNYLSSIGWDYEGIGWVAPSGNKKAPVYRLYNPNAGDHHYTLNKAERDNLVRIGWKNEGIGWYSDTAKRVPLYRAYNPNASVGTHNYTTSKEEQNYLCRNGWKNEGIGWYASKTGKPAPAKVLPAKIVWTWSYNRSKETGKATAYDNNGKQIWTLQSGTYGATQLHRTGELLYSGDTYYYYDNDDIVAVRAADGREKWRCTPKMGGALTAVLGNDGKIYVGSYFTIKVAVISSGGVIEQITGDLAPDYMWMQIKGISGNEIFADVSIPTRNNIRETRIYININDWSVRE
ncbi:MAG: hypothetical protein Q4B22_01200 [Eubacteriales bacterium]|nr:hypothetical protein [Eubacteriales bacterium]